MQDILFSNLILKDVTGPISIDLNNRGRSDASVGAAAAAPKGFIRNISFNSIRANVVAEGGQFSDIAFAQNYRPGETRQCIVLNAIGDCLS